MNETPYAQLGGDAKLRALEESAVPELLRLQLMGAFAQTADWMRNKPG